MSFRKVCGKISSRVREQGQGIGPLDLQKLRETGKMEYTERRERNSIRCKWLFLMMMVGAVLLENTSYSSVTPTKEINKEGRNQNYALSEVLKTGLTSIRLDPPQMREALKINAQFYARMRHGSVRQSEKNRFAT